MREILFRGKMPVESKWAYGSLISEVNVFDKRLVLTHIYDKDCNEILVDPQTVGQYTGLTDKNGMKIFEGDVIHGKLGNFVVRWNEYIGAFVAGVSLKIMPCLNRGTMKSYEVIGNIHDNPELIEG